MNDEETTEHLVSDYDDLPPIIPAVEVDMVVDDTPIVLNDDEPTEETAKDEEIETKSYDEELKESGLCEADIAYIHQAYPDLEPVKYIKMHCTSCDRHLGTAPNQLSNRYEHPLLKVLICEDCFQFYSSGDFEKDEDGSELYCRWCGEGGQVFCCTTCPFVFCKRCIVRNLGRATASLIQNSDNWLCFACSPDQISRHRANFWAIQKYSAELIRKHEGCSDDIAELNKDANMCCNRKRSDPPNKSKSTAVPPTKRRKVEVVLPKSAAVKKTDANWKQMYTTLLNPEEPEAEVICTPDIIPIEDSPPNSPFIRSPPPLVACKPIQAAAPVKIRLNSKNPDQLNQLQNQLKKTFSQRVFITPPSKLMPNQNAIINNDHSAGQVSSPLGNKNFKIFLKKPPLAMNNSTMIANNVASSSSGLVQFEQPSDWFDKALVHCAEVTQYITTKMAALSDVHARAHLSTKLMEELHNTIQTYLYVAIEKLHKVKSTMQNNFDAEWKNDQVVNPFASSSSSAALTSKQEPNTTTRARRKRRKRFSSDNSDDTDDEDIIFDMDVVNESDEESSDDDYMPAARTSQSKQLTKPIQIASLETICIDTDSDDDEQQLHKTNVNNIINEDVEEIQSPIVILSQSKDDTDSNHSIPKTDDNNTTTQNETPDDNDDESVPPLDLEDEISGNVVLRSPPNKSQTTFRDEFSKFISRTEPEDSGNDFEDDAEDDHDDSSPDTDTNTTVEPGNDDSSQDKGKNTNVDQDNDESSQDKGKHIDNNDSKDKETTEDSNSSVKDDLPTENNTGDSLNEDGLESKESLIEDKDKDENDVTNKEETQSSDLVSENTDVDRTIECNDIPMKNHINESNEKRVDAAGPLEKSDDLLPFVLDMVGPVDNGALSLPPGGVLTDFLATELKNCAATKSLDNEDLDHELLALKQIAENCVNAASTDVKNSAECQG